MPFLYTLKDSAGKTRYVGKTFNPARRFRKHVAEKTADDPVMVVLAWTDEFEIDKLEEQWIKHHKDIGSPLVNTSRGLKAGTSHTDEYKQKMREKWKDPEYRANIVGKLKGRKQTKEHRENNARARTKKS